MGKYIKPAIFVLSIAIVVSFFLPWVMVQSKQTGAFTKALTGKRQQNIAAISGFQVPVMANGDEARLISSIAKIFNPSVDNIGLKSFLVVVIPLLAVAIAGVNYLYEKNKWANAAVAVLGILIFLVAIFKLTTTDLDKLILQIKIGIGMWVTLISFLGIGIASALRAVELSKK